MTQYGGNYDTGSRDLRDGIRGFMRQLGFRDGALCGLRKGWWTIAIR